jgi:hypothetical protein
MDWAKIIESTGGVASVALFALWVLWLTQNGWFKFMTGQTANVQAMVKAMADQTSAVNELLALEQKRSEHDDLLMKEVDECHHILCEMGKKRRGGK